VNPSIEGGRIPTIVKVQREMVNHTAIRVLHGQFKSRERNKIMKHDVHDGGPSAVLDRAADKSGSGKSDAEKQEMMKKMEAAGTPGPAHKALEAFVGNWKAEVKCWHEGGAPQVSQATAKSNWTLNGRFVEGEFHGEMMGKKFLGRSLLGYDNTKQKFNSVWVSDIQTSMFTSEGKGENGNKVITLEGKGDCAATGRKDVPMKQVFRVLNPDKYTFEMFDGSNGDYVRKMEITYTRQ
jgi:hypothetical protein